MKFFNKLHSFHVIRKTIFSTQQGFIDFEIHLNRPMVKKVKSSSNKKNINNGDEIYFFSRNLIHLFFCLFIIWNIKWNLNFFTDSTIIKNMNQMTLESKVAFINEYLSYFDHKVQFILQNINKMIKKLCLFILFSQMIILFLFLFCLIQ